MSLGEETVARKENEIVATPKIIGFALKIAL
jgi:hypothetical protein